MDHTTSNTPLDNSLQTTTQAYGWTHSDDGPRHDGRPGCDQLLDQIANRPAGAVLEVGCGSARNLRLLYEKASHHDLFGLDPSLGMLATARDDLERAGCHNQITLAQERSPELNPAKQFRMDRPFDVIFFSYVASRCPSWAEALEDACSHLAPDGRLYVLDAWQHTRSPAPVATFLDWTGLVPAEPRPPFLDRLRRLDDEGRVSCAITPVAQRSAYLATVTPRPGDTFPQPPTLSTQAARPSGPAPKRREREKTLPA